MAKVWCSPSHFYFISRFVVPLTDRILSGVNMLFIKILGKRNWMDGCRKAAQAL
jgi:hypothetical protein